MLSEDNRLLLEYFKSLLNDVKITQDIPSNLNNDKEFSNLKDTLKTIRNVITELGSGNLSYDIKGYGYVIGSLKNLQASLRSLTWKTKAIAAGDFSQNIHYLGEFSEAFNNMTKKIESSILEIKETQEHLEMIFNTIPDPTIITSFNGEYLIAYNQAFLEGAKFTNEELEGRSIKITDLYVDLEERKIFLDKLQKDGFIENFELHLYNKIREKKIGLISSRILNIKGVPHILSVIRDVTEKKIIEKKLLESEERHRLLADNAEDVIWTMDLQGNFTYISPSVQKLRGYTVEEVMAQSQEEVLCPGSLIYLRKGLERAIQSVQAGRPFQVFRGELEQPCKDGTTVWTETTVSGIYNEDERFIGMLGVTRDISDRKVMEEEILRLSITDKLTQSYNRLKLDETLEEQFDLSKQASIPFTILILDIDHFKRVNDTYGHQVGDRVLVELVSIFHKNVRANDIVGRWGGEEFLIVLPQTTLNVGVDLAEKIRSLVEENHFDSVGQVTISIGVSTYEKDLSPDSIVSRADTALYKAKESGRNRVEFYIN